MPNSRKSSDCVLVIDDDTVMREVLTLLLGAEGHEVISADSPDAAVELLAILPPHQAPTVVLTDLTMPGVSPAALPMRLRLACPESALLLAMSGSVPKNGEAGAFDAFLSKPFGVADYDAAVERARTRAFRMQPAGTPAVRQGSTTQAAPVPALDEAVFAKLCSALAPEQLAQLYSMFTEDAATRADRMSSAAATGDDAALVREAHAVKGSCGMLGAMELQALAGRMEEGGLACSSLLNDFHPAIKRLRHILKERIVVRT